MEDKKVGILSVPIDMGGVVQGTRFGPETLLIRGLRARVGKLGLEWKDFGHVEIDNGYKLEKSPDKLNHLRDIVKMNEDIVEKIDEIVGEDYFPLLLGGDHSMVLGSVKGLLHKYENIGLVYVDAHADINTQETTITGNIHGMPVSALLGLGHEDLYSVGGSDYKIRAEDIVYIGLTDVDPGEVELLRDLKIKAYTMDDVREKGISLVIQECLDYLKDVGDLHLSFDTDSLKSSIAPGTGIRLEDGLDKEESMEIFKAFRDSGKLRALEVVELNPLYDRDNMTADLLIDLICQGL